MKNCLRRVKLKMKQKIMNLKEVFPSVFSQFIFVAYMAFCIGQGMLVKASSTGTNYAYDTVAVVLLTETTKLILSIICYFFNGTVKSLVSGIRNNLKVLCLYLVPSFLYCIYNNLAFVNLSHFDPTTYFIFLQLRIVFTGSIFQVVFNKKLSKLQWLSLVLLTCGCIGQQIDWNYITAMFYNSDKSVDRKDFINYFIYFFLVIVQTLCSCFAGVYNEFLLKDVGANVNVFIQNIFMYVDSILWNLIAIYFQKNVVTVLSEGSLSQIMNPLVITLILNNSLVGIITSLFLKNLNSILKNFASAIELIFTAFLSWIIFGIPVKLSTGIAIFIICYSLHLYSQNPVNNSKGQKSEDKENLLEDIA